jgi:hypothetical protein
MYTSKRQTTILILFEHIILKLHRILKLSALNYMILEVVRSPLIKKKIGIMIVSREMVRLADWV